MRRSMVFLVALGLLVSAAGALASNDTYSGQQWNLEKVGAAQAWGGSTGGVKVGIVDSGVDAGHPDISGHVAASVGCDNTNGDASQCNASGDDIDGHGTHVAGIIAATKDNNEGVAGVAPSAQLVVARVFSGDSASVNDILAGARWVVSQGARVVNFSLGDAGFAGLGLFVSNADVKNIANDVWNRGAIPVVASGNNGCASWGNVNAVVVTATGPSDDWANYACSVSGAQWGIAAPGGNASNCDSEPAKCILSSYARSKTPSDKAPYAYLQGTSMAAPMVTGALANLLATGRSREDAINTLLNTADGVACGTSCRGRLNVARAVCGSSCPAVAPTGNGGSTNPPPVVTPSTTYKPPAIRKSSATPATTRVTAPPTTAAPAPTTTEAPTTTTEAPTTTTSPRTESAIGKRSNDSENDLGVLPAGLALLGLLGAGAATGWAAWRRRLTAGGAL